MWIQSLDVLHNERPLILHFENFGARFVTWSCTNDLQLLQESDRFNSSSLRALDCLDACTASGLLLHLERLVSMSYLSSLFIELRKEVFEEDSNSSSFEFKIKDNLFLIWFEFDLILDLILVWINLRIVNLLVHSQIVICQIPSCGNLTVLRLCNHLIN